MAEETQTPTPAPAAAEEVVVAAAPPPPPPPPEKITEKEPPPAPEAEEPKPSVEAVPEPEAEKKTAEEEKISQSVSFKEESNRVADLPDPEKKALEELKQLIQEALNKHEFTTPPPTAEPEPAKADEPKSDPPAAENPVAEEPTKTESDIVATAEEPGPSEPAPEPTKTETTEVTVAEVVETVVAAAVVVDDDGAKTVEAIEETVVAVTVTPPAETEETPVKETVEAPVVPPEEVFIWGIPLLGDEKSDVVLLKFLRARDFKAKDAFTMIKNTVQWRKEFGIEKLVEEDLGNDLDKVVFMHGFDRETHPVCYNVFGEFQNKELYQKTFSDEEKGEKFLRWRIQFLEKGIRHLDFRPDGINTFVQVTDLSNSPGLGKRVLRQAMNRALSLLQDNYPEFVAKQILINVPWWYLAFNRMISPFMTQRSKSKFVYAGPSKSSETLFRYIAPEQVPVQYGGLSKENDDEFTAADAVTEITIKPATKQSVEIPVSETCLLVWELRVLGWDVSYTAEFVPSAEEGYTVIVQKTRKLIANDEPILKNSFKIGEPGKVVLTIDNTTSKKKKLLYRSKTKSSSDSI